MIKIILLTSPLPLCFHYYLQHLCFSFTLQLINGISNDLSKLLKCFNGTATVAFFRIMLTAFGAG